MCAYLAVVAVFLWPSTLPINGRFSPLITPWLAALPGCALALLLHVITETACHAGHLDAARELLVP